MSNFTDPANIGGRDHEKLAKMQNAVRIGKSQYRMKAECTKRNAEA